METNGVRRQMGFKSAKGGGKGSKAARRNVGGDKSDAHKRKAEEAFMSPLEVMRQITEGGERSHWHPTDCVELIPRQCCRHGSVV